MNYKQTAIAGEILQLLTFICWGNKEKRKVNFGKLPPTCHEAKSSADEGTRINKSHRC